MKKILVVVDMQKDFISGALGTAEAAAIVPGAAEKIRGFDGDIFVTFDTHFEDYMETAEGKKLPVPHCIKGTDGWELDDKIAEALSGKKYTAVEKITFGSVELPELVKAAAAGEAFSVTLMGLCTDICVVSNALLLKASFPGAEIAVDADCCAGVTAESHQAALTTMRMCQIDVYEEEKTC
ncbi:MAG: cysteine hydrolase [Ruminococcus sp.]|nr:cysteine hydrolase [Ruminococcus sp.]